MVIPTLANARQILRVFYALPCTKMRTKLSRHTATTKVTPATLTSTASNQRSVLISWRNAVHEQATHLPLTRNRLLAKRDERWNEMVLV